MLQDPTLADADAVATACVSSLARGLTAPEAALRLARNGANLLRSVAPVSSWRRAVAQLHDPLVYLLLGAAAVALAVWMIEEPENGTKGWPMDTIVIGIVVLINAVLGWIQESKAHSAAFTPGRRQVTLS